MSNYCTGLCVCGTLAVHACPHPSAGVFPRRLWSCFFAHQARGRGLKPVSLLHCPTCPPSLASHQCHSLIVPHVNVIHSLSLFIVTHTTVIHSLSPNSTSLITYNQSPYQRSILFLGQCLYLHPLRSGLFPVTVRITVRQVRRHVIVHDSVVCDWHVRVRLFNVAGIRQL